MAQRQAFDLRLLGPLEAYADGKRIHLGPPKQRAVLGVLALNLNRAVSADALIELLWEGAAPAKPHTAVQGYVSGLRKALGPEAIATTGGGYVLEAQPTALDSVRFEELHRQGRSAVAAGRHRDAASLLADALALWRGGALADFAFDSWAQTESARLDDLRLLCEEDRLEVLLACGEEVDALGRLETLVAAHPLRERPAGLLMLALYRLGRQAEALEVFQEVRERLRDELGLDPGTDLQALQRRILNQDPLLAPAPTESQPETNVPAPATAIVGRGTELAELTALLADPATRLLTLTGPGGIGKTRLAHEIAWELVRRPSERVTDGVWFVDLSAVRDPALVMPTIVRRVTGGEALDALADRRVLVILDNFEQLLAASVEVAALLRRAQQVRLLVTSREPLRIQGEHEYAVPPLRDEDAAALFVMQARAVDSSFEPDATVLEICRRLDGLPLAVQLAAARVKMLAPVEIVNRLGQRLSLLTRGPRDLPERQQTLRATIAWSYDLLEDTGRRAFERLSIFAGGFTLEAAEEVADVDLDVLSSLVDRSLVRRQDGRFAMLETIREFAAERLTDSDVRRRHLEYYLGLAEQAKAELDGPDQPRWLARFDVEAENVRTGLMWALNAGDGEFALRLANALGRLWRIHGRFREGRRWFEHALELPSPPDLRLAGLVNLGSLAIGGGDYEVGARASREAIELSRRLGDDHELGRSLNNLGVAELYMENLDSAAALFEESLAIARRRDDSRFVATTVHNLGEIALSQGDLERARLRFEEALGLARALDHAYLRESTLLSLGAALVDAEEFDAAAAALGEALELSRELDDSDATADVLESSAAIAASRGSPAAGAHFVAAASDWRDEFAAPPNPGHARRIARVTTMLQETLGEERWHEAWCEGRALGLGGAADEALDLLGRAT